jgi:dihydrofolate reductase
MRKISVSTMVSLDGVTGDPQAWAMEYLDEAAQAEGLRRLLASDAMLLGRTTYEALGRAWNGRAGGFAERVNTIPKHVFSSTLAHADWGNATLVRGDVVAQAAQLKEQGGADLVIFGHGRLSRTLLKAGLIDEFRLLVLPVFAGRGELFFSEIDKRKLKLSSSMTLANGVVILIYAN